MKLEKQVCSLELAKKLKELGVKQDSHFYWRETYHTEEHNNGDGTWDKEGIFGGEYRVMAYPKPRISTADVKWNTNDLRRLDESEVSAYTVAELGEKLLYGERLFIPVVVVGKWSVPTNTAPLIVGDINLFTEADTRALVLIYFLENNLIKINANSTV